MSRENQYHQTIITNVSMRQRHLVDSTEPSKDILGFKRPVMEPLKSFIRE